MRLPQPIVALSVLTSLWLAACSPAILIVPLEITSASRLPRVVNGELRLQIKGLSAEDQPTLSIHSVAGGPEVDLAVTSTTAEELVAQLVDPTLTTNGLHVITLYARGKTLQTKTTVYTPPIWVPEAVATPVSNACTNKKIAFVEIFSAQLGTVWSKYECPDGREYRIGAYGMRDQVLYEKKESDLLSVSGSIPKYATDDKENIWVYFKRFNPRPMQWTVRVTNAQGTTQADVDLNNQSTYNGVTVLPEADFFVRAGDNLMLLASNSELTAFHFGLGVPYRPLTVTPPVPHLRLLQGTQIQWENSNVDVVGMNTDNQLLLLSQRGQTLSVNQDLSTAATKKLGDARVKAITTADIDQDGIIDLVFALSNAEDKTDTLAWLPYLGKGQFGNLEKVPLPPTLADARPSLAIADINQDGRPDLAMTTPDNLYVFFNQAL